MKNDNSITLIIGYALMEKLDRVCGG